MSITLSELEGAVLGVIWRKKSCSGYAIRQEFRDSPSRYWSGSAGAIYPLITRMEGRRLVASKQHARDARRTKLYSLTASGLLALREWVGPPVPEIAIGVPMDVLRTRVEFLDVLSVQERRYLLSNARERLRIHTAEVEEYLLTCTDKFARVAAIGALLTCEARLIWLTEALKCCQS